MGYLEFAVLMVLSLVISAALHYWLKYYVTPGHWSFVSKVIIGYVGGWIGPTVFGDWGYVVGGVPVCTASLGVAALLIVMIDVFKGFSGGQAAADTDA